jgi:hypothetical protein
MKYYLGRKASIMTELDHLPSLVEAFTDPSSPSCKDEIDEAAERASSIEEAIRIATLTEESIPKHGHQWRISPEDLETFKEDLLKRKKEIENAEEFHSLFEIVQEVGEDTHGIGELAVYDTAERLAHGKRMDPDGIPRVYLQRGAKEGARHVLDRDRLGRWVPIEDFPEALKNSPLNAFGIEVFLCVCKEDIEKKRERPSKDCKSVCGSKDKKKGPGGC